MCCSRKCCCLKDRETSVTNITGAEFDCAEIVYLNVSKIHITFLSLTSFSKWCLYVNRIRNTVQLLHLIGWRKSHSERGIIWNEAYIICYTLNLDLFKLVVFLFFCIILLAFLFILCSLGLLRFESRIYVWTYHEKLSFSHWIDCIALL